MKNRLFALLLVVALVITVSVFAVGAEETNPFEGKTGKITAVCPHCGGEAVEWAPVPADTDSQMTNWADYKAGYRHFYLEGQCLNGSSVTLTDTEVCLNLNGQTYLRKSGTVFYTVDSGATLNIMDTSVEKTGKMSLNGASQQYHVFAKNGGVVNQYGGTFDNVQATATGTGNGSAVRVESGATYTMYDGNLLMGNVTSTYQGGAVYVNDATFVMHKGTIVGKCKTNGGAIAIVDGGEVVIHDGTITGTTAQTAEAAVSGGGIFVTGGSTLTMNGGTIKDSYAGNSSSKGAYGGAIAVYNSNATINGGKIYNNTAKSNAQNIYIDGYSKAGETTITSHLTVGGTAQIGHDTEVQSGTTRGMAIFGDDNANITIQDNAVIQNFTTTLQGGAIHTNSGSVTINMTGGTIQNCSASYGGAIAYNVGTTFNFSGGEIKNCTATSGGGAWANYTNYAGKIVMSGTAKITNCSAPYGGALYSNLAGTVMELNGGTIQNCSATTMSGAAHVEKATLKLNGVTIKSCTAPEAGAVGTNGTVTMTAGTTIDGCTGTKATANQAGGGAFRVYGGTATLSGGTIKNCSTTAYGGAIMNVGGTVNLSGVTIDTCTATSSGGAYGASGAGAKLNFSAGEIKNCSASSAGALYFQWQSKENTMSGTAKITNCRATGSYGGAIHVSGSGTPGITISGGTISGCYAKSNGGVIYMAGTDGATVKMTGGRIEGNATDYNAGGSGAIFVNGNNTFELDGGTIYKTYVDGQGGAIYAVGTEGKIANVTFKSGLIDGTRSDDNYGGIIMKEYTNFQMSGGTIQNTTNQWTGGGLTLSAEKAGPVTATITGGLIQNCTIITASPGAGLYIGENTTATVSNLTVKNCYIANAGNSGGNVYIAADAAAAPTFTNCTFEGGYVNGVAQATYGGNVFAGKDATFTDCTFTGGAAVYGGGNLHLNSGVTVTVNGDSYFTAGKTASAAPGNGRGGNISAYNATLNIGGNTVVDGTGTTGVWNGFNINMYGSNTVSGGVLNLSGNAVIKNAPDKRINSVTIYHGGVVTIDGAVQAEGIYMRTPQTVPGVTIKAGFTGEVFLTAQDETLAEEVVPGNTLTWVTQEAGYNDGGTVKALDADSSAKVLLDEGTTFKVAQFSAFVDSGKTDENGKAILVEKAVADLSNSSAVEYFKSYLPHESVTNIELTGDTYIDMNNSVINFTTNGNKLYVIDNRTDGGKKAAYTKFTVDDVDNLERYVINEDTGYQYIITGDNEKGFTSNRVRVTLDKLSIKTTQAGIYYTTTMMTNANVVPYIVTYGTAASIVEMPTANFVNQPSVLYTEYDKEDATLTVDGNLEMTTRSALIADIVKEDAADNGTRSATPIYASSFIIVNLGGDDIYVMADKTFDLSLNDAMERLDAKYGELTDAQKEVAVNFYTKWLAEGAFTGADLPNLAG